MTGRVKSTFSLVSSSSGSPSTPTVRRTAFVIARRRPTQGRPTVVLTARFTEAVGAADEYSALPLVDLHLSDVELQLPTNVEVWAFSDHERSARGLRQARTCATRSSSS